MKNYATYSVTIILLIKWCTLSKNLNLKFALQIDIAKWIKKSIQLNLLVLANKAMQFD